MDKDVDLIMINKQEEEQLRSQGGHSNIRNKRKSKWPSAMYIFQCSSSVAGSSGFNFFIDRGVRRMNWRECHPVQWLNRKAEWTKNTDWFGLYGSLLILWIIVFRGGENLFACGGSLFFLTDQLRINSKNIVEPLEIPSVTRTRITWTHR